MSGSGGGKPGLEAFWDSETQQERRWVSGDTGPYFGQSLSDTVSDLHGRIKELENKLNKLEELYMEHVLLGKDE